MVPFSLMDILDFDFDLDDAAEWLSNAIEVIKSVIAFAILIFLLYILKCVDITKMVKNLLFVEATEPFVLQDVPKDKKDRGRKRGESLLTPVFEKKRL